MDTPNRLLWIGIAAAALAWSRLAMSESLTTMEGEIVCLPHRAGLGEVHTLECTFGLLGTDGNFYGLQGIHPDWWLTSTAETGTRVAVSGAVLPVDEETGTRYEVVGTIEVVSIEALQPAQESPETAE